MTKERRNELQDLIVDIARRYGVNAFRICALGLLFGLYQGREDLRETKSRVINMDTTLTNRINTLEVSHRNRIERLEENDKIQQSKIAEVDGRLGERISGLSGQVTVLSNIYYKSLK